MDISTTSVSRVLLFVCCLVAVFRIMGCSERIQLYRLHMYRRDSNRVTQIATDLKDNPKEIKIALRDFSCFGGSNRGMSSWMLTYSSLPSVNESLERILYDAKERPSRRVEAAWILWWRTNEYVYLQELFQLVKDEDYEYPLNPVVQIGRHYLSMTTTNKAIHDVFALPPSDALPITESAFEDFIRNRQVGRDLPGDR